MAAPRCSAVAAGVDDVPFYEEDMPYYARPSDFTQPRIFSAYEPTINTCSILPSARDPYAQPPSARSIAPSHVHPVALAYSCYVTGHDYAMSESVTSPFETPGWYCKGYFKPDAYLDEEHSRPAADMRHSGYATKHDNAMPESVISPFETPGRYCKGYFKRDAYLDEERSYRDLAHLEPNHSNSKANIYPAALYHTKELPPDELRDLFPQSLWKLKVAQHERALSTRGLRFPGYPPSMLNPEWEKYYADEENGGTTL